MKVLYRFDGVSWGEFLSRCEALAFRGAIIGPHGSGKTTLLEELEARLQARQFSTVLLRLDSQQPDFEPGWMRRLRRRLDRQTIVLLDGAEQLNFLKWLWFRYQMRWARGLIITSHGPGRLPTLWTCRTSSQLLADISAELLQSDSRSLLERSGVLYQKHQGNLREALREWYDICAGTS